MENKGKIQEKPSHSFGSGMKFLETTLESQVNAVKEESEKCLAVAENIKEKGEKVTAVVEKGVHIVEDGARTVKEGAEKCVNLVESGTENIMKMKRMCQDYYSLAFKYKAYLEADSIIESTIALAIWLLVCYTFRVWMIPIGILIIFIKNFIYKHVFGIQSADEPDMPDDKNKSWKEKMEAIQEITSCIQSLLAIVEQVLGKITKILNFHSLHLSWLAVLIQLGVTFILIYVPINYLLMLWGISLYVKKFLKSKTTTSDGKPLISNDSNVKVMTPNKLQEEGNDVPTLNIKKGL